MFQRVPRSVLALGLALACAVGPARAEEPANLSPHKQALATYIDSGEYGHDVAAVCLRAGKYLAKRVTRAPKPGKKLAVVFDIDETALTNLPQMLASDFGYVAKTWDAWVAQGQAHAIIPVQTVYDAAVRAKIDVIFITGRPESTRTSTERNLREVGYDTWASIFYKPADQPMSTARFKTNIRRKLTQDGYIIVANIGDQDSDLVGGYAERIYKLPNPFYLTR